MTPEYPECDCGNLMDFIGTKPHQAWFACLRCGKAKAYREMPPRYEER